MQHLILRLLVIAICLLPTEVFANADGAMAEVTYYVTPGGAGTKAGEVWANAMDWVTFEPILNESSGTSQLAKGTDGTQATAGGTIFYVYTGTYTLTGAIAGTADGTAVSAYTVVGVDDQTTHPWTDRATGDNRPLFVAAANNFTLDNYWRVYDCRFTSTAADCFGIDSYTIISGCSSTNSSAVADRTALNQNTFYTTIMDCQVNSPNGVGFRLAGYSMASFMYVHDSKEGCWIFASTATSLNFSIFDRCTTGIDFNSSYRSSMMNNTFYKCDTGLDITSGYASALVNNIFNDSVTVGLKSTGNAVQDWLIDYNNWEGNATDITSPVPVKGINATAVDPQFVDPDNADPDLRDFSLNAASACVDAGMSIENGVQ